MKKKIGLMILSLAIGLFGTLGCEKKSATEKTVGDAAKKVDKAAATAVDEGAKAAEDATKAVENK